MTFRCSSILALVLGTALLYPVCALSRPSKPGPKPATAAADGTYNVNVAGSFQGKGSAVLTNGNLTITASVVDDDGNKGDLVVKDLAVNDGRFTGTGTVISQTLEINGRIDTIPADDPQVKTVRLMATFSVNKEFHGRVVGYVPRPPDIKAVAPPAPPTGPGPGDPPPVKGGGPPNPPPDHGHHPPDDRHPPDDHRGPKEH